MYVNDQLVKKAVNKICVAAQHALDDLQYGRVQQEPAFTDRLLANMQTELQRHSLAGVDWHALTLPDRGRNSAESQLGADFLSVVQFDLPNFKISKGFLAQSKLVEPGATFSSTEYLRMQKQCEKMLLISPASYVFLYSLHSGIKIIPAIEIVAAKTCNPHELTSHKIATFFTQHFECFIGDQRFHAADRAQLESLREEYSVRAALMMTARPSEGADAFEF